MLSEIADFQYKCADFGAGDSKLHDACRIPASDWKSDLGTVLTGI
ncbi:hypothetical protein [Geopseudomonas aromaticivorans]|nr:hypothetical protein [Pseudomonas aromaticivorans]